jgi:DNA-binding response OmpR family regulator
VTARAALLLDDDPAFRRLVRPLLTARGFAVHEAASLAEATQALQALGEPPALIVSDGLLPDGSAVGWLRALPEAARALPVLFVSAHWKGLREHRDLRQQLSGLAHLELIHKPVGHEAFTVRLDQLLGRASAPPLSPELAQLMAQLKAEYGAGLPAKLEELRKLVRLARAAPADPQARKAARTAAHKLAGTAGSYGFPEESITAAVVEAQAVQAERLSEPHSDAELEACWALAEAALDDALPAAAPVP